MKKSEYVCIPSAIKAIELCFSPTFILKWDIDIAMAQAILIPRNAITRGIPEVKLYLTPSFSKTSKITLKLPKINTKDINNATIPSACFAHLFFLKL